MANKLRKMLGDKNAPYTRSLLQLIEVQEKTTVCKWCINYAEQHFLPIFERCRPDDNHPRTALNAARDYLDGKAKFSEIKGVIWYTAADGTDDDPVAQAAERAVGQAASVVRYPSRWHAIAVYFYGAAAIAYNRLGLKAGDEEYNVVGGEVCANMTAALQVMAAEDEPNPADIGRKC